MKKTILFLFAAVSSLCALSQIPNNGFENWSNFQTGTTTPYNYEMPVQWKTTDSITVANSGGSTHSASKESSSVQSGTYSLRLQSWSFLFSGVPVLSGLPGCATNGDVIIDASLSNASITPISGTPDTVRHAQLSGYYSYTSGGNGNDSGSIEVCLFKYNTGTGNRDTVARGSMHFHNQGTYAHFSVTINQYGLASVTPDSMLIWIQSSERDPLGSGQTGSILLVDSLYFTGVIGINEINGVVNSMNLYPVPAKDELTVDVDLKRPLHTSVEVLDLSGRKILSQEMDALNSKVNVSSLSDGNYILNLLDEKGNRLSSGKFAVRR